MKKLVLIFALFAIATIPSKAQGCMTGKSYWQVESSLGSSVTSSGIDDNGQPFIMAESSSSSAMYFFDDDEYCIVSYVFPSSQSVFDSMLEKFNDSYTADGDGRWTFYDYGVDRQITVVIETTDDNTVYFGYY